MTSQGAGCRVTAQPETNAIVKLKYDATSTRIGKRPRELTHS